MTVLELHDKLAELVSKGWRNESVKVLSANGNRLNADIYAVVDNQPPIPTNQEIHILADD